MQLVLVVTLLCAVISSALAVQYESLGCWKDSILNRAIEGSMEGKSALRGFYWNRENAVEKCAEVANSKGYTVFGVQNGGECWSAVPEYQKHGESNKCKDGKGGHFANSVYKTLDGEEYESLGCWRDKLLNRAIEGSLEGKSDKLDGWYIFRKDEVKKCAAAAHSKGYTVFGVQNGGECWSAVPGYQKHGESTKCKDGKGSSSVNSVYQIVYTVHYESLGCWKDSILNRAIEGRLGKTKMSVEMCAEAANSKGYTVFGLQHGGECWSAVPEYQKHGASTRCKDGKGGFYANSVYKTLDGEKYESLGCWRDSLFNRAIEGSLENTSEKLDGSYGARENAVEKCAKVAHSAGNKDNAGYTVFGVQNGGECWSTVPGYKKHGRSTKCQNGIGSTSVNSVYQILPGRAY